MTIKFNKKAMEQMISEDGFYSYQNKVRGIRAEVLFNTYVVGDTVQEFQYIKFLNKLQGAEMKTGRGKPGHVTPGEKT